MAARKRQVAGRKALLKRVEVVLADAIAEVKALVDSSLRAELSDLLERGGSAVRGGKARRAPSDGTGRPGRKPSWTPAQVDRLVELVKGSGEVVPQEARKRLKVSTTQLNGMVKTAKADGRIKVEGRGRGTRYVKA